MWKCLSGSVNGQHAGWSDWTQLAGASEGTGVKRLDQTHSQAEVFKLERVLRNKLNSPFFTIPIHIQTIPELIIEIVKNALSYIHHWSEWRSSVLPKSTATAAFVESWESNFFSVVSHSLPDALENDLN